VLHDAGAYRMVSPAMLRLIVPLVCALALPACRDVAADDGSSSAAEGDAASAEESETSDAAAATEAAPSTDDRPPPEGVAGGRDVRRETLVVVEPLTVGPIRDEVVVSGKVKAAKSVFVFPRLSGLVITEVPVEKGDEVRAGDVLMRLFDSELKLAEETAAASLDEARKEVERQELMLREQAARIVRAERQAQKTRADYQRLEDLVGDGLVNQQEVDDARLAAETAADDLELARFSRDATQVALDLAVIGVRQAEIRWRQAEYDLSQTVVRTPIGGIVASRGVEVGELATTTSGRVNEEEPGFEIVDITELELDLRVPQDALPRLAVGQRVEVSLVTGSDALYTGRVRAVVPVLDATTGTVHVLAELDPAPGLVPGLFCEARIITAERDEALLVDKRAVLYEDDQPYFFAVDEAETSVQKIPFVAGASTALATEIVSNLDGDPLAASLRVVVVGQDSLKDGSLVRLQEEPY